VRAVHVTRSGLVEEHSVLVADAQRQMRQTYRGGLPGQLVSGGLWLASAAAGTWGSRTLAVLVLAVGGCFIFPLTMLALRLAGRAATTPRGNPLNALAMQVAFTVPLALPVVLALAYHAPAWFYPAMLIVVGAHYLPFVFLYGMWQWAILAAALLGAGFVLGAYLPLGFTAGGWFGGVALVAFAFAGWRVVLAEERRPAA
jgi:hypothetical protein